MSYPDILPCVLDFCGRFWLGGSDDAKQVFGITGKAAKIYNFSWTKAPKLFQLVWTSSISGRAWRRSKPTYKIPWKSDFCGRFWLGGSVMRNGIFGWRGKQRKYYFSWTKAPKLFQPVRISPLVEGRGMEAKMLLQFLENQTFVDGSGWEVVTRMWGFWYLFGIFETNIFFDSPHIDLNIKIWHQSHRVLQG